MERGVVTPHHRAPLGGTRFKEHERLSNMATALDLAGGIRQFDRTAMPTPDNRTDDAALVNAARGGDREAFGQLYERFVRMVHGILLARVPRGDAEDLVQDVFLAALRQLHALRDAAAFPGWLAMIARNRASDHHRRAKETTELPEDLASRGAPETEALAVLAVIKTLPEAYRETLILRLVEGMTGDEIAARAGLTPASVRVNLHRGMKQLREKLGKEKRS
jgi:RNA polymerase sigma-70 factor (ECF subfamily)